MGVMQNETILPILFYEIGYFEYFLIFDIFIMVKIKERKKGISV